MKKRIASMLLLCAAVLMLFTGCGKSQTKEADAEGENKTSITIGCMPLNEAAVSTIADAMNSKGYNVEVKVFDGNNLPAQALKADEIDCLILNHLPWITNFNKENNAELTMVKGFSYSSYNGLYSSKHTSVDQIPDGGKIIISNDPSNMDRGLRFLQKLGLITLGDKTDTYYTVLDIKDNPKNLQLIEVETTNTAGSYQDADAAISFSSVMRNAGIDPTSYIAEDGEYVNYPTGIFVNKGDDNSQWAKDMVDVTKTQEFIDKFNEIFQGAYVLFDYE